MVKTFTKPGADTSTNTSEDTCTNTDTCTKGKELARELEQFYGGGVIYYNPLMSLKYTEGVRHFLLKANAYWFYTDLWAILHKIPDDSFYYIELTVKNSCGLLKITDGNSTEYYSKVYNYTDCPEGTWKFFVEGDVLLLPSEH